MTKQRLIKAIVCLVLITSFLCLTLISGVALDVSSEKLSSYLVETLATMRNDDELEVTVFFKEMNDNGLRDQVISKYGKDINIYEDENRFYSEVVPNIKVGNETIKSLVSKSEISIDNFSLDNEKSTLNIELRKSINKEIIKEMNEYVSNRREARSDMMKQYLEKYKSFFNSEDIVFSSEFIEMLIVRLNKSEILELSNNPYVESIHYSENDGGQEAWVAPLLIEADSTTGTGSINYNNGSGYDGTGITIGIIESNGTAYDSNDYNLKDAHRSRKLAFVSTDGVTLTGSNIHSTLVTAIICGKKVTVQNRIYEGLARGSQVYQTAISSNEQTMGQEFYRAVEKLTSNPFNVNIINFSGGLGNGDKYSEYDKAVDKYVEDYKIVFVKSAGNTSGDVTAPGKAFNAITVGCLEAKTGSGMPSSPFGLKSDSAWYEEDYLPNKPDVVAPGTKITLPTTATSQCEYTDGGTSFAAPVVSGVAAQLMQSDAMCIANPNYVKNLIMNGASNDLISETEVAYGELLEKTGAGLVNAVDSFGTKSNKYFETILYTYTNRNYETIHDVYLKKGQTIKIVLSYNKEENIFLTNEYRNNLDLRLAQTAGNVVHAVSESTNNNVEIIEFKATSSGTYNIQVRMRDSMLTANGNADLHYCVTWRIL